MSIERIKQDAAKADQLITGLTQGEPPAAETPVVEQEAATPEVGQDVDQGVATAATEDPNREPTDSARAEAAKWEQRYRSLDGMIQARDRQIEQLHQLIAGMQQAQATDTSAAKPAHPTEQRLVTEQDENAFGADLIDMVRRAFKEEQGQHVAKLEQKIAQMEQALNGVSQTTAVTAQERFETKLTEAAPAWRTTDADPGFVAWLQASPTRHKLFAEAARAQDVADVAYFFNEYAQQKPAAAAPQPAVDPRLERQLAPGKSRAAPTPASQTEKKVWTRSEIADLFANGKKRHSAADFDKLQRDAFAAQKDGRVDFTR